MTPAPSSIRDSDSASAQARRSSVRYRVLGLTFCITFIMYLDRVCIGMIAPVMMQQFHIDKIGMGWSTSAFNWSYALFQVPGGWLADRFGPRLVLFGALTWWSLATSATGLAFNVWSLAGARFLFGVGEAAAFPSSSRALVRWLPVRQRAFGQGFQHAGSRFGAAVAPAIVVFLLARISWQAVFFVLGAAGLVWALVWYWYYRDDPRQHKGVNTEEISVIIQDQPAPAAKAARKAVPWRRIVVSADLWFLSAMYFCYGWVVWLYLLWLPTYFMEARHFTQFKMGIAASIPLLAATVTNIAGGWLSDKLSQRWSDLRRGRTRVSTVGFAIAGLALIPGVLSQSPVTSLVWLTVALAGLELTVAVSWAICLDIGGDFTGSVSSVMNTFGNLGGAACAVAVGYIATYYGWNWPFLVASGFCLLAAVLAMNINPARPAAS